MTLYNLFTINSYSLSTRTAGLSQVDFNSRGWGMDFKRNTIDLRDVDFKWEYIFHDIRYIPFCKYL